MGTTITFSRLVDLNMLARRFPLLPPICCGILLFAIVDLLKVIYISYFTFSRPLGKELFNIF